MKRAFFGLLLCALGALLCGCASGPSLRALDAGDAKVVVTAEGQILVHGQPVALYDLHKVIADSSTEPNDLIIVQLQASPNTPGMKNLMRAISREMTFAQHYKYSFSTPLQAYTQTFDKHTGTTEVFVSGSEVKRLKTVEDKEAEVERMKAEAEAYERGTYVSNAEQKPVSVFKGRSEESAAEQEKKRLQQQWKNRRSPRR